MMMGKKVILWLLAIPVITGATFVVLNYFFYQEPAEVFQQTGDVATLLSEVTELEDSLSENPKQTKKILELAHCYQVMGRYPEAISTFGKAWDSVEKSPDELTHFADVLARNKGNDFSGKPIELLKQALALDSENINALILYGTALISQQQNTLAAKQWEKAFQLMDEDDLRYKELEELLAQLKSSQL